MKRTAKSLIVVSCLVLILGIGGCTIGADEGNSQQSSAATSANADGQVTSETGQDGGDAAAAHSTAAIPDGTKSSDGLTVKDIRKWSLPTDPYYFGDDQRMRTNVTKLLTAKCFSEHGKHLPVTLYPTGPEPRQFTTPSGDTIFNAKTAKKFGYHPAEENYPGASHEMGSPALDAPYRRTLNGAPQKLRDDCNTFVDRELSKRGIATMNSQVYVYGDDSPSKEMAAAAEKWRKCMAPKGIPDLPKTPTEPAPSLMKKFGMDGDSAPANPRGEEIAMATFDAQCRASSGWDEAEYSSAWHAADEYVNAHQSSLQMKLNEIKHRNEVLQQMQTELAKSGN